MSLVHDAAELVPGDPASLEQASQAWAELAHALTSPSSNSSLTAQDAHSVSEAVAALACALRALRAEAEQVYVDLRSLDLPGRVLFADPELMKSVVHERPTLREPLEQLIARGTRTRLAFVDAQHDLVDSVQPIARRFVPPADPV